LVVIIVNIHYCGIYVCQLTTENDQNLPFAQNKSGDPKAADPRRLKSLLTPLWRL